MKQKFDVTGMTCSACSAHVEKSVRKLPGVSSVAVNLLQNTMMVEYDGDALSDAQICDAVKAGGYGGQTFPGLHDGVVSMSAFSDKVPAEVAEQVNAIIDQIKTGELVITPNYSET